MKTELITLANGWRITREAYEQFKREFEQAILAR
jgi:hypothetical protein